MQDYKDVVHNAQAAIAQLRKDIPEVMSGFTTLGLAASKEGALSKKTKELITVALSVAARCEGCVALHVHALVKLGVTRPELLEALGMAIYMGGGPSVVHAAEALRAYDEFSKQTVT